MFALNGAFYTGVDLMEAALDATRRHFATLGLSGMFRPENAQCLSFADGSFDMVYSHGVLHHTPNPGAAIDEVHRVLKPGGRAVVMLYHRHSFNYYAQILIHMRLRVLLSILRRAVRWRSDRERLSALPLTGVRGNTGRRVWEIHYQNFLRDGWVYLKARNFVNHCTDGPECPIAFPFSRADARRLFSRFREVHPEVAHFPLNRYPIGNCLPFGVEKFLASKIG